MVDLFLKIANMSITASWMILAVLIFRFFLKKAPKWVNILLWGMVAMRLAVPISLESFFSLIPKTQVTLPEVTPSPLPEIPVSDIPSNNVIPSIPANPTPPAIVVDPSPVLNWTAIVAAIWILGAIVLAVYGLVSYWRLHRRVRTAIHEEDQIYRCDTVAFPFILGFLKPRIYLPFAISERDVTHVIAHERAHIARKDHWWKPLGYALLTAHWFNPFVWLAYILLCRDIELACDEKVIRNMGSQQRADYSQTLLSCSINRKTISACPLAFGDGGVKERVKTVLHYKKPAFWIIIFAIIACVVIAVCFLTNPAENPDESISSDPFASTGLSDQLDHLGPAGNLSSNSNNAVEFYTTKVLRIEIAERIRNSHWSGANNFEIQNGIFSTTSGTYKLSFTVTSIQEDSIDISFDQALVGPKGEKNVTSIHLNQGESIKLFYKDPTKDYCVSSYIFSIVDTGMPAGTFPSVQLTSGFEREEAHRSSYVVMENFVVTSGYEIWKDFYEKAQAGTPAKVRLLSYVNFPELEIEDFFPIITILEFTFDGDKYTICEYNKGRMFFSRDYQYLMYQTDTIDSNDGNGQTHLCYMLTNDDNFIHPDISQATATMLRQDPNTYNWYYVVYSQASDKEDVPAA